MVQGLLTQVQVDLQHTAVAQAPARGDGAVGQHVSAERHGAGQVRHHVRVTQAQQVAVELGVVVFDEGGHRLQKGL